MRLVIPCGIAATAGQSGTSRKARNRDRGSHFERAAATAHSVHHHDRTDAMTPQSLARRLRPVVGATRYRVTTRDLRLGSGLVLFTYLAAHLANHALGLVSLNAAEIGLRVAVAVWHS